MLHLQTRAWSACNQFGAETFIASKGSVVIKTRGKMKVAGDGDTGKR